MPSYSGRGEGLYPHSVFRARTKACGCAKCQSLARERNGSFDPDMDGATDPIAYELGLLPDDNYKGGKRWWAT